VGIADLTAYAMALESGRTVAEERTRIFLVDSKGIVGAHRTGLEHHKASYAHPAPAGAVEAGKDLVAIIHALKPTALIGVSAQGGAFTEPVVKAMMAHSARPLVFALSNPTSKAECTAEQAYAWSAGAAIFASGSPFDPVKLGDATIVPGQANNRSESGPAGTGGGED